MKIFLTFILITGFCFAEEPVKPLPKDVQTIVDAREKALQEARIAFDKAVFKANDDAVKKMETVVKTNTQKGDLDGALASKKFVEEWNKEKDSVAVTGALGGAGPGEKKNFDPVGNWQASHSNGWKGVYNLSKGGIIIPNGKWKIKNDELIMSWNDKPGLTDIYKITGLDSLDGLSSTGVALSIKKIVNQ